MDDPRIIAAVVGAVTAVITAFLTAILTVRKQSQHLEIEHAKLNVALEELRREHSLAYAAERVAHALLKDEQWRLRTFEALQRHLGGFDENELRKILVCSGAIRFYTKKSGTELWGLLDRNKDRLGAIVLDVEPEVRPLAGGHTN